MSERTPTPVDPSLTGTEPVPVVPTEVIPVTPAEAAPVIPITGHEGDTALGGVRGFLHGWRTERLERKLTQLESTDHVIREAGPGARLVRGFRSEPEDPEVMPITLTERVASQHRQRQVRKIKHAKAERYRITQNNGVPRPRSPESTTPLRTPSRSGTVDAERWNAASKKQVAADRGLMTSFDTTSRMKPRHARSVKKAIKSDRKMEHHLHELHESIDRGAEGDTRFARRRAKKIEKVARKLDGRDAVQERIVAEHTVRVQERKERWAERRQDVADKARRFSEDLDRRYDEHKEATKAAYQEGLMGPTGDEGFVHAKINKAARATGKKLGETKAKRKSKKQARSTR